MKAAADAAKDAVNIEIHTKAQIIEIRKQQAAELSAINKDINEKASMMAGIAHERNQINLKADVDAKKAQADELKNEERLIADFQRSIWQAQTGVYDAELKDQAGKKKEQGDELIAIQKKIAEFNKSVLQVEDAQINDQAKATKKLADQHEKEAERVKTAWANAMANLSTRIGESFADMVVNMKFNTQGMIDLVKNFTKQALTAVISGFVSPATSALGGVGQSLARSLGFGGAGALGGLAKGGGMVAESASSDAAGNLISTTGKTGGMATLPQVPLATLPTSTGRLMPSVL